MWRFLAGALACFLMLTGAFLFWQGRAEDQQLPPPPAAGPGGPLMIAQKSRQPPEASPKSREEKRFDRADKNKDGRIELAELLEPRRKPFAKLDTDRNQRTAAQFRIDSIPALLIFKRGQLVDRLVGVQPKPVIEQRLAAFE